MQIDYVSSSHFLAPILEALKAGGERLTRGERILVALPPGGYGGSVVVRVRAEVNVTFEAFWKGRDHTRFPARLRAAATALRDAGFFDTYRIEHADGLLTIENAPDSALSDKDRRAAGDVIEAHSSTVYAPGKGEVPARYPTVRPSFEAFLSQIESTPMTRSYKMIVLKSMLELHALPGSVSIERLTQRFVAVARRYPFVREEVGIYLEDPVALRRMLIRNPLNAWTKGAGTGGIAFFTFDGSFFASAFAVPEEGVDMAHKSLAERVDQRIEDYLARKIETSGGAGAVPAPPHPSVEPEDAQPEDANPPQGPTTLDRLDLLEKTLNTLKERGFRSIQEILALFSPAEFCFLGIGEDGQASLLDCARREGLIAVDPEEDDEASGNTSSTVLLDVRHLNGHLDIFAQLVPLIDAIGVICEDDRGPEILRQRYGLDGRKVQTLAQIGEQMEVTRERVRQLEKRALDGLRDAFSSEFKRRRSAYHLPRWMMEQLESVKASFVRVPIQMQRDVIEDVLRLSGRSFRAQDSRAASLVLASLGLNRVRHRDIGCGDHRGEGWTPLPPRERQSALATLQTWTDLLKSEARPVSLQELKELCGEAEQGGLDAALASLPELPGIERVGTGAVRASLSLLGSHSDRAFAILSRRRHPLHFREIAEIIAADSLSGKGKTTEQIVRGIASGLSNDERFAPIGRTGKWKLASWNEFKSESIADLVEAVLRKLGRPADASELFSELQAARADARLSSMIAIISMQPARFYRTSGNAIALVEWEMIIGKRSTAGERTSSETVDTIFSEVIDELAGDAETLRIPTPELVAWLAERGIAESTARARLGRMDGVELEEGADCLMVVIKRESLSFNSGKGGAEAPLREAVCASAAEFLERLPGHEGTLSDLCEHVMTDLELTRTQVYYGLRDLQRLERWDAPGGRRCRLLPLGDAKTSSG